MSTPRPSDARSAAAFLDALSVALEGRRSASAPTVTLLIDCKPRSTFRFGHRLKAGLNRIVVPATDVPKFQSLVDRIPAEKPALYEAAEHLLEQQMEEWVEAGNSPETAPYSIQRARRMITKREEGVFRSCKVVEASSEERATADPDGSKALVAKLMAATGTATPEAALDAVLARMGASTAGGGAEAPSLSAEPPSPASSSAEGILDGNVPTVRGRISDATDASLLSAALGVEKAEKNRSTVIEALESRLRALAEG